MLYIFTNNSFISFSKHFTAMLIFEIIYHYKMQNLKKSVTLCFFCFFTVSTEEPQPEPGNTKPQLEQDDMTANIIAVVIAVAIIGAVVAMLVVTKL